MPEKKQFTTAAVLFFIMVCCLAGIFYIRSISSEEQPVPPLPVPLVKQGLDEALNRLESLDPAAKSSLMSSFDKSKSLKVELVFAGMRDKENIGEILSILEANSLEATFYITGVESTGYSMSLSLITDSGYPVGVAYHGNASVAGKTAARRAITDFVRASASILMLTGLQPSTLLSLSAPDEDLLDAASASSLDHVIVPAKTVPLSDVSSLPGARELLDELPRGGILCLQLEGMTPDGTDYIRRLCAALSQTDLSKQAIALLSSAYEPASEQMRAHTTERAAAFTFAGLGNQEELDGVLSALESVKAAATFFLSASDLTQYPSQVRAVLDGGHALGIAAQSAGRVSTEAILAELLQVQETLSGEYGYTRPLAGPPGCRRLHG